MALTAQFGGGALPTGWSFAPNGATSNAVLDNSGDCAEITIPAGTTSDSITSTGSVDNTCGLVHAVSGDFDIAQRISTPIGGDQTQIYGFVLRGSTNVHMIRYTPFANDAQTMQYGYQRSGGSGSTFRSPNPLIGDWLEANPSWVRCTRVGTTYTFSISGDGLNWVEQASTTSAADPLTVKLCVGQYSQALGLPFRIDRCVDMTGLYSDARNAVPAYYPGTTEVADLSAGVPSWMMLATEGDGDVVLGVGAGPAFNPAIILSTAPADGSSGRILYNGAGYLNAGMLASSYIQGGSGSYGVIGLGVDDGGGSIDVYSAAPGYIEEIHGTTGEQVSVRVHRPLVINIFNEPYLFLGGRSTPAGAGVKVYCRVEKYGSRLRMRRWRYDVAEPTTWDYDGEEDSLRGLGPLKPYLAIGHNPGTVVTAPEMFVEDLEFYELTDAPPSVGYDVYLGDTQVDAVYLGSDPVDAIFLGGLPV